MRRNSATFFIAVLIPIVLSTTSLNEQNLLYEEGPVEETDYNLLCNDSNVTVSFSQLSLNDIRDNFLSSPLITCLDLNKNSISSISNNAFYNLQNLKYLDLSRNSFDLNEFFKSSFSNLESLIINDARDASDDLIITGTYSKLRKLFLKNNRQILRIRAISKMNFPMLSHLYLSGNFIRYDNFDWLPKTLEYLDLTGHNLQSLTLQNLRNLKWLRLKKGDFVYCSNYPLCNWNLKLETVNFENLQSLLYLSIPSNNIREITSSTFSNLTSLRYLDLSDNSVSNIEVDAFQSMQNNLVLLNVSNNNIETLRPGTLNPLKSLKILILEKNLLKSIPMIIEKMNLETLFLNCNKIKNVGRKVLMLLPNLISLHLQDNEISQVNEEAFAGLEKLKMLSLANNKISALPSNWILPMISLEELDLSGNQFIRFSDLSLSDSSPVQYLYLSNQLRYLEAQSIYSMPENVTIYLNDTSPHFEACVKSNEKYFSPNRYG